MDPMKVFTKRSSVHVLQSSDQQNLFTNTLLISQYFIFKGETNIFFTPLQSKCLSLPVNDSLQVDHVPAGMAGFCPWTRGLVGALGFSHSRHGRRLVWCLWGSLSTGSTVWVPSMCPVWDCFCKHSRGSPAHPHKVEVNKSDTESGHVASLHRQPR